ncbi:MAG: hypothetical protein HYU36_20085 [Planctomycetes bacterium]|nr:hypothetical protein [Planctomycetota bacterium]
MRIIHWREMRCLYLACSAAMAPALSGRAGEASLQPLGSCRSDAGQPGRRVEFLWPILEWTTGPEGHEEFLRPLWHSSARPGEEAVRYDFLYPIVIYHARGNKATGWLFPLYFHTRRPRAQEGFTRDDVLFPVLFKGQDRHGRGYLAVLPFGGRLRDIFLKDEVDIYSPFYIRTRKKDLETHHVLGPLVGWSRGADTHGGRVWPLFGEQTLDGKWRRGFVLWPFLHYYESDPESGKDQRGFIFVPFFARRREGHSDHWSVLFPFLGYSRNRRTGIQKWNVPWPLLEVTTGRSRGFRLFPIFGRKKNAESQRQFALWPIYHRLERRDDSYAEAGRWVLPFYWSKRRVAVETGKEESHWQLWPFARSESGPMGKRTALLALLPFRDPAGAERIYAPLWELLVDQQDSGGGRATSAFWRLYRHERHGDRRLLQIAPLYRMEREDAAHSRWSILLGLLSCEQSGAGRAWQLFHVFKFGKRSADAGPSVERPKETQRPPVAAEIRKAEDSRVAPVRIP